MSLLGTYRSIIALASGLALAALVTLWPMPLDSPAATSLKLYWGYVSGKPMRVSALLGKVDVVCAVGPYDSFSAPRFAGHIKPAQVAAAEQALQARNATSFGDNKFFLVGLRGDNVSSVYASGFFSHLATLDRLKPHPDCVPGDGSITAIKTGNTIAITFTRGA